MQPDDVIRLRHILDAAREAIGFVRSRCREDLDRDRQLVWALVKAIEIIGMRHRLIHAYFDINLDILWRTVREGLPPLITELEKRVRSVND
jgi:uncharacterized protein with HEPN domain